MPVLRKRLKINRRACFHIGFCRHETGATAARYFVTGIWDGSGGGAVMRSLIGAAVVAGALALAGPAAIKSAAAAPQVKAQIAGTSDATDFSARRYYRRYYGYRPYYRPYYYARPYYYRPYPYYAPAPFVLGFGFGPFWW
jgi:hypothetical protein